MESRAELAVKLEINPYQKNLNLDMSDKKI